MPKFKSINIRDFQHNLSMYIDLVKIRPLIITRNGVQEAVFIDPASYEFKEKPQKSLKAPQDITRSAFVGMYKDRKDWKTKSSSEIADRLREGSWHGN